MYGVILKKTLYLFIFICALMFSSKAHSQIGPTPCGTTSYFSTWNPNIPYLTGQVVIRYLTVYQALVNNQGWDPCTSPSKWTTIINGSGTGSSTPTGPAGGGLTGTYPNPGLNATAVNSAILPQTIINAITGQTINVTGLLGQSQQGTYESINRDTQLNAELNPLQFNAAGDGTYANGDDCDAIDQMLITAATIQNLPYTVKLKGKNYLCGKAKYQIILPHNNGDYSIDTAGTGAMFSLTIDPMNGSILSCNVSGGSGYNPNEWVIGQVQDPTRTGSGGAVYAATDNNGVPLPGSCVVRSKGIRYPVKSVMVTAIPQGSDGASVSFTLTAGVASAITVTPNSSAMPNGNGYVHPTVLLPPGLTCTTGVTTTSLTKGTVGLSTTAIVSVSWGSAPPSGCTYNGSNSGTVPVFINASIGGGTQQAVNLVPPAISTLGCAIALRAGINIDGEGAILRADWPTGSYTDGSGLVTFCDPFGDQARQITISNLTSSGIASFWLSDTTQDFYLHNVNCSYGALQNLNFNYHTGTGGGLCFYAATTGPNTVLDSMLITSPGAILVGGQKVTRGALSSTVSLAGGSGGLGGWTESAATATQGGAFDGLVVRHIRYRTQSLSSDQSTSYALPVSQYSSQLDTFIDTFLWKSNLTPLTNTLAPNGTGVCFSTLTQTPNIAIDWLADITADASTNPEFLCYRGVSGRVFTGLSRSGHTSSHVTFDDISMPNSTRSIIEADMTQSTVSNVRPDNTQVSAPFTDPYLPSGTKQLGFVETPGPSGTALASFFTNVDDQDSTNINFLNQLSITSGAASNTTNSRWILLPGVTDQP
jgi:hypothetical protein